MEKTYKFRYNGCAFIRKMGVVFPVFQKRYLIGEGYGIFGNQKNVLKLYAHE